MEIIRKYNQCTNPHDDEKDLYFIKMYYNDDFHIEYHYNTFEILELYNKPIDKIFYDKYIYYITYDKEKLNYELETLMIKKFFEKQNEDIKNTKNKLKKLEKDKKLLSLLNKYFRDEKIKKITE